MMEYYRRELAPCVYLTALRTDQFKTGYLTASLLTQLSRERAALNAVLPYVLRRGTTSAPDMRAFSARLDGLYGAAIEPKVRKLGEIQALGFAAAFSEDRYLPEGQQIFPEIVRLMGELWLSPNTRGGLFLPDYVDSERQNLLQRMESLRNDRRSWAVRRLVENMCAMEDYAVSALGSPDEAENIHYVKLTKDYRALLGASPVEFFYCGSLDGGQVARLLADALLLLPRGEIDLDMGTDVRMNALEAQPRYFTEEMDVTQGNLAMGFRLGECMEDTDDVTLRTFNTLFGSGPSSRLFRNVRERMSLCYYASSSLDFHKGILTVSSGIDFDKYDAVREEILAQLDAVRRGEFSDDELETAKATTGAYLRLVPDSLTGMESFYTAQIVRGMDASPEDHLALLEDVTKDDVIRVAQSVELDAVYFLRGEAKE